MESQKARNALLSSLLKISHGELEKFFDAGFPAAQSDPELFAHVIAWNMKNGRVRDSKVAFPVVALRTDGMKDSVFAENAVAHLMALGPRELVKAYTFSKQLSAKGKPIREGRRRMFENALKQYLAVREAKTSWWDAAVLRNREAMHALYAVSHKKPSPRAQAILFDKNYPANSVFAVVKTMAGLPPLAAGGLVMKHKIPLTVAIGAGLKLDSEEMLLAIIKSMTGNELIGAAKQFSKLKSFSIRSVKDAYEQAVSKVKDDKRVTVGKAMHAQTIVQGTVAEKVLTAVKEKAAESLKKVSGDWLILADKSGSMSNAIAAGKQLASLLAHRVEGKVYLVFFDVEPRMIEVTGKTLEQIEQETRAVRAGGGTSIGCGLRLIRGKNIAIDGVIVISDGGQNTVPEFSKEYKRLDHEPVVYFLRLRGDNVDILSREMELAGIVADRFDLSDGFDHYALSNVVNVLKPMTYGFLEEVLATPLITLQEVFAERREHVVAASV